MMYFVIYLVLCLMVALLGYRTPLGFFRGFVFCVMLTPFVVMLYLLIFTSLSRREESGGSAKEGDPSLDSEE